MSEDFEAWLAGFRPPRPDPLPLRRNWLLPIGAVAAVAAVAIALLPRDRSPLVFTIADSQTFLNGTTPWSELMATQTAPPSPPSALETLNP